MSFTNLLSTVVAIAGASNVAGYDIKMSGSRPDDNAEPLFRPPVFEQSSNLHSVPFACDQGANALRYPVSGQFNANVHLSDDAKVHIALASGNVITTKTSDKPRFYGAAMAGGKVLSTGASGLAAEGDELIIECSTTSEDAILIVTDDSDLEVTTTRGQDGNGRQSGLTFQSNRGQVTKAAVVRSQGNKAKVSGSVTNPIHDEEAFLYWRTQEPSPQKLTIDFENDNDDDTLVVQTEVTDGSKTRKRTLAFPVFPSRPTKTIDGDFDLFINANGDVQLSFDPLDITERVFLSARFGLKVNGKVHPVVDIKAIQNTDNLFVTVDGGWFRTAVKEVGAKGKGWKVVLIEATAVTEGNNHPSLVLETRANIIARPRPGRKDVSDSDLAPLEEEPSEDELAISENMQHGRRPAATLTSASSREMVKGADRSLLAGAVQAHDGSKARVLLVHGYCSDYKAWISLFLPENAHWGYGGALFHDPTRSRSNDFFAQEIIRQAGAGDNSLHPRTVEEMKEGIPPYYKDVSRCSILSHSQGGLASIHLFRYYWSCLDNVASKNRYLMQTLHTPFHGTPAAGIIAVLTYIFKGIGCGYAGDMTTSVARANMSSTGKYGNFNWAATNSYRKGAAKILCWLCDEYCDWWTDLIFTGRDDGVVPRSSMYLPGATDLHGGTINGSCHTKDMRYRACVLDFPRIDYYMRSARFVAGTPVPPTYPPTTAPPTVYVSPCMGLAFRRLLTHSNYNYHGYDSDLDSATESLCDRETYSGGSGVTSGSRYTYSGALVGVPTTGTGGGGSPTTHNGPYNYF